MVLKNFPVLLKTKDKLFRCNSSYYAKQAFQYIESRSKHIVSKKLIRKDKLCISLNMSFIRL